jgi:hypothetical protein
MLPAHFEALGHRRAPGAAPTDMGGPTRRPRATGTARPSAWSSGSSRAAAQTSRSQPTTSRARCPRRPGQGYVRHRGLRRPPRQTGIYLVGARLPRWRTMIPATLCAAEATPTRTAAWRWTSTSSTTSRPRRSSSLWGRALCARAFQGSGHAAAHVRCQGGVRLGLRSHRTCAISRCRGAEAGRPRTSCATVA